MDYGLLPCKCQHVIFPKYPPLNYCICIQVWPIFARGGDYGPKYEVVDYLDQAAGQLEKRSSIFKEALAKKDLESLLHQPDPALTVQELSPNPKISFRKGWHLLGSDISTTATTSTETPNLTNKAANTGMKELVPVYNPIQQNSNSQASVGKNPLMALFESRQLRALAAAE